jgi:hypothetical protein
MQSYWYVEKGEQRGPVDVDEAARLIKSGAITRDSLVWAEGMADWTPASQVEGLAASFKTPPRPGSTWGSTPRVWPTAGAGGGDPAPAGASGGFRGGNTTAVDASTTGFASGAQNQAYAGAGVAQGALRSDFPMWGLLGRMLLYVIAFVTVVPLPWVLTWNYQWITQRISLPNAARLRFDGTPLDVWPAIVALPLLFWIGRVHGLLQILTTVAAWFVAAYLIRWFCAKLRSEDGAVDVRFTGDYLTYAGWMALTYISFVTIIGWAWVAAYFIRWMCAKVEGTKRFSFNATGLEILWRTLVTALASVFIIPIPWVLHWYVTWFVNQFSVEG